MTDHKKSRRQMTPEEIDTIRQKMLERKKILWNEIMYEIKHEAGDRHQGLFDTIRENGDRALEDLLESKLLGLVEIKARELENIEAAINRLESGNYGRCASCGKWIRPARLEVQPFSVRCRKCQEQQERIESV